MPIIPQVNSYVENRFWKLKLCFDEKQLTFDIFNLHLIGRCQKGFIGFNSTELICHYSQQSVNFVRLRFLWNIVKVGGLEFPTVMPLSFFPQQIDYFRQRKCRGADPKRQGELAREDLADL